MQSVKQRLVVLGLFGMGLLASCKKSDLSAESPAPPPTPQPPAASSADILKDSALLYARDIYLWYNQIPASFNARSHADLGALMTSLRQFSMEPGFTAPVDRWSFAMRQQDWNNVSSGISGDFGLTVFFRSEGDLRVKLVEKESPAGLAGVRRGWRITSINGNTNLSTSNASFIVQNIYQSSSVAIGFQKPDNSTVTMNFSAASYRENPIVLDTVYNRNGRQVGYLAFNSFLGDTTRIYNEFSRIFNRFAASNVSDVIVDLRYNGGGYVSMSQKLANWLAPSSANGQLMMRQQFNDKYSRYNEDENFRKLGSLNLSRIFFIVSSSTASASELLINNLKPYMDVQLVGPSKTYGKPAGYFPIPVGDWYIFPISFKSVNKAGEGNYYNGLALNSQAPDGLDKDWGDVGETALQSALNYITTGAYRSMAANGSGGFRESPAVISGNQVIDQPSFKGAIDTRRYR
jgi:carboxyl-terminal processing protease